MDDIRRILKMAARRIEWNRFLDRLHAIGMVGAGLALVVMLVDHTFAESFVLWWWGGPILGVVMGLVTLLWWSRGRRTEHEVAVRVDERLELREKLSTALHCGHRDDPFARAAVEDAVMVAREARNVERTKRSFAIAAPRGWWISPLLVLLTIMANWLPQGDWYRSDEANPTEVQLAKVTVVQTVDAVIKQIQENPELKEAMADALGDLAAPDSNPDKPRSPEQMKREALKKITDLNKKLDDIIKGEKGKTADAIERALKHLETPSKGPAKDLAEAMKNGDFGAAKKALEEMAKKLQKGELNEEQKKQLAEQLKDLADQMDKLAQQQGQLAQALKNAGMDPQLANNPQALQQAIQNNQNLNEQQKQQLEQMAKAQQQANQMMKGMGQAMQQMAQNMPNGQMGQGMQQMQNQLNQMEQMQQMLMQAQAMANMCQGQCKGLGQGLGMKQAMQQWSQGKGMGQWGQGAGGKAPIAPTPTKTILTKAEVKTTGEGGVVARQFFKGEVVRGEAKVKMVQAKVSEMTGFDEALTEDDLPRRYHEAHKHYFGELEKIVREVVEESDAPVSGGTNTSEDG